MQNSSVIVPGGGDLSAFLERPEWCVVQQDDQEISSLRLRELANNFAVQLGKLGPSRVAVHAVRADMTLAALIAALETGCELLLVRELLPPNDSFWSLYQVASVFDGELDLLHSSDGRHYPEKAAVLLTTSGTTGKPKLALHEVSRLLGRVRSSEVGNRWLLTYHPASFAGIQVLLTALCTRSLVVAFSGLSAAALVAKALCSDVTHLSGTPTFGRSLLMAVPQNSKRPAFRQITLGGEAVDQTTLDALHAAFPEARIIHIYASTEAGSVFAVKDLRAGFPAQWLIDGVDGCRLRISEGVLQLQSSRSMKSYCGKEPGLALTNDGWLVTGDVVEVVGDRVLFSGRVDSIINVGGGKVMPEQVEAILLDMPLVREARVYGVKNPLAGDVLAADVVLATPFAESDARRLIFSALSARLEPYKVPRIYRFVDQIQTNSVGKKVRMRL